MSIKKSMGQMGSFDEKMTLTIRKEFYIIKFILVCEFKIKLSHIYMFIPFFVAFCQSPQELENWLPLC